MAKNRSIVYLGYEDEPVTDKHRSQLDFTVNKVGGRPDWPSADIIVPPCSVCNSSRSLIVQIYAPLEASSFHRTLYVFACLNSYCSNQSDGWICIRTQVLEKNVANESRSKAAPAAEKIAWCTGADDWGDEEPDPNSNEANGNVISRMSDEDDESTSFGSDPIPSFGGLSVDDRNANNGAQAGACAMVKDSSPVRPSAEIEGAESEVILIDSPPTPQRDVLALLASTAALTNSVQNPILESFFVAVEEEQAGGGAAAASDVLEEHVRELLQEYQMRDESARSPEEAAAGGISPAGGDQELYERGVPVHGDVMFHQFLTRLQANPGQLLRYSRDAAPLLIAPLAVPFKCQNCGGETICEAQILPTIIPKLRLENGGDPAPIDFGNVLVLTCAKSCWDTPDRMRFEAILVQQEVIQ